MMYNHHQTGPAGTVMFAPPFRDPHNHNIDPLLINGLSLVGAAMHTRFAAEEKPGVVMRNGASYQTWWNGGLRTTAYFHNQIGILTETIGSPTPIEIPLIPDRQLSTGDLPYPIRPQPWHFRQSIDYSITANRAILDLASRYREHFLYNIYLMGRNASGRGTRHLDRSCRAGIEALKAGIAKDRSGHRPRPPGGADRKRLTEVPARPRRVATPARYVIPADQPDFPTATRFVNALLKSGVDVHRATRSFEREWEDISSGVVGHQDRPVLPGPRARHDGAAGLSQRHPVPGRAAEGAVRQRGVHARDADGRGLRSAAGAARGTVGQGRRPPQVGSSGRMGRISRMGRSGWTLSARYNDAITAVNRLLKAGAQVSRLSAPSGALACGDVLHRRDGSARAIVQDLANTKGLRFEPADCIPSRDCTRPASPVREWGSGIPTAGACLRGGSAGSSSRWKFPSRWCIRPCSTPGTWPSKYDVLIFPDGAIPATDPAAPSTTGGGFGGRMPRAGGHPRGVPVPAWPHDGDDDRPPDPRVRRSRGPRHHHRQLGAQPEPAPRPRRLRVT